jgi:hypothetical protein
MGRGAFSGLRAGTARGGDPSLRLKNGYAQDDDEILEGKLRRYRK